MELKQIRESGKIYLVVEGGDTSGISFAQKMVEDRRLSHIISCKCRHMNSRIFYYFDVTGKIPISLVRKGNVWKMKDIMRLFQHLHSAREELDRYLLQSENICMDPSVIYYDLEKDEYFFLFSPESDLWTGDLPLLMEYFLENLDNDDNEAVDFVYRVYEYVEAGSFSVSDIICLLASAKEGKSESVEENITSEVEERRREYCDVDPLEARRGYPLNDSGNVDISEYQRETCDESRVEAQSGFDSQEIPKRNHSAIGMTKGTIIWSVVSLVILGCLSYLYFYFELTRTETILVFSVGIFLIIFSVVLWFVALSSGKKQGIKERDEMMRRADILDEFSALEGQEISLSEISSLREERTLRSTEVKGSFLAGSRNAEDILISEAGEERTVYFEPGQKSIYECKLFSIEKRRAHISLSRLPLVIGKRKELSDVCLDHPSISRIHARLEAEGEELIITDLSSMNGTFINGVRLGPGESRSIFQGDEVRLGELVYELR